MSSYDTIHRDNRMWVRFYTEFDGREREGDCFCAVKMDIDDTVNYLSIDEALKLAKYLKDAATAAAREQLKATGKP